MDIYVQQPDKGGMLSRDSVCVCVCVCVCERECVGGCVFMNTKKQGASFHAYRR